MLDILLTITKKLNGGKWVLLLIIAGLGQWYDLKSDIKGNKQEADLHFARQQEINQDLKDDIKDLKTDIKAIRK